jgi:hypothetical protein
VNKKAIAMKTTLTDPAIDHSMQFRKSVIYAAIQKQEALIRDFKQRINDLMSNDGNVNEEEYDNHLQSFKSEGLAEVNSLNNELQFAARELEELRKIDWRQDDTDHVHFGSIVETDEKVFFISISLEEFVADGSEVFGISVNAPLYLAMKDKKVGDPFAFNNIRYQITHIY